MIFKRRNKRFIPIDGPNSQPIPDINTPGTTLLEVLKAELDKVIDAWEEAKADQKISISEVWTLITDVISSLVKIAEAWGGIGSDKKAGVMAALELLYDNVIAPIDIKIIPNLIEPTIDKWGKHAFLQIVDGLVDGIVNVLNQEAKSASAFTEK